MGLKVWRPPNRVVYQYWAAFVANVPTFIVGICIAWNGTYLASFVSDNSPLKGGRLTDAQMSWMPTLFMFGGVVGTIPCFWIPEMYGRQRTLFWISFLCIAGWAMTIFKEYYSTVVARFILGLSSGFNFVVTPTFVSEIADDKHRGTLGAFLSLFCNFGIFAGFGMTMLFSYQQINYIMIGISFAYLAGIVTVVESPTFYELKGDMEMKAKALSMYRDKIPETSPTPQTHDPKEDFKFSDFFSTEHRKCISLAIVLIVFPTVSGSSTLVQYANIIFEDAETTLSPTVSSIIVALIQFIGAYVATLLVDRLGRKLFVPLRAFLGRAGYIWTFAVACIISCIFTIFYVPETKGKSKEAIANSLKASTSS